eukprot:316960_1
MTLSMVLYTLFISDKDTDETIQNADTEIKGLIWQHLIQFKFFKQNPEMAEQLGFTKYVRNDFVRVINFIQKIMNTENESEINAYLSFITHPQMHILSGTIIALYSKQNDQISFKRYFKDGKSNKIQLESINQYDWVLFKESDKPLRLLTKQNEADLKQKILRKIQHYVFNICDIKYHHNDLIQIDGAEFSNYKDARRSKHEIPNADITIIPDFLKSIVLKHCSKWLSSAWDALLYCENNKHYLLKNGQIKIIDLATGTILQNVVWQNGLHQFLELKHNLKMTIMGFAAVMM